MPRDGELRKHQPNHVSTTSKPFSLSIGSRAAATNPRKRPHSTLNDESESDDDRNSGPQLLTGFDRSTGRAITENAPPEVKPLVIPEQKNRDWRAEAERRKGKNLLPEEEQARRAGRTLKEPARADVGDEEAKPTYGLLVSQRSHEDRHKHEGSNGAKNSPPPAPKTADEEALEALLGNGTKSSSLVIGKTTSPDRDFGTSGHNGNDFKSDVDARPDVPSLTDYAAVPIEEFGRALMRGMGWKEGEELGKARASSTRPREVKMRPALLGIGAKEVPDGLEEMGAWGKGAKKSRRIDRSYMPLVMQNDQTGEKLTEEELEKRRQTEKPVQSDMDERRDKRAIMDSKSASAHRHRDHDGDGRRERSQRNGHSPRRERKEHDRSSSHRHRDHRDSSRDRRNRRDDYDSDKRQEREKSSRHHGHDERKKRGYDDRDRRDRERNRDRSKDRERRR